MNKKNKNCCCMLTLQHLNIVYGKRIILWLHSQWIYRLVVVSSCCILFNKLYFLVIMFQAKIFEYFLTASFQFLVESLPLFAHRIYSILNMDEKMLFSSFFFFASFPNMIYFKRWEDETQILQNVYNLEIEWETIDCCMYQTYTRQRMSKCTGEK